MEKDSRKSKTGTKPVFSEPEGLNTQSIASLPFCASKKVMMFQGARAQPACARMGGSPRAKREDVEQAHINCCVR